MTLAQHRTDTEQENALKNNRSLMARTLVRVLMLALIALTAIAAFAGDDDLKPLAVTVFRQADVVRANDGVAGFAVADDQLSVCDGDFAARTRHGPNAGRWLSRHDRTDRDFWREVALQYQVPKSAECRNFVAL